MLPCPQDEACAQQAAQQGHHVQQFPMTRSTGLDNEAAEDAELAGESRTGTWSYLASGLENAIFGSASVSINSVWSVMTAFRKGSQASDRQTSDTALSTCDVLAAPAPAMAGSLLLPPDGMRTKEEDQLMCQMYNDVIETVQAPDQARPRFNAVITSFDNSGVHIAEASKSDMHGSDKESANAALSEHFAFTGGVQKMSVSSFSCEASHNRSNGINTMTSLNRAESAVVSDDQSLSALPPGMITVPVR